MRPPRPASMLVERVLESAARSAVLVVVLKTHVYCYVLLPGHDTLATILRRGLVHLGTLGRGR